MEFMGDFSPRRLGTGSRLSRQLQPAGDLKRKPVFRAAFNANTPDAVKAALAEPRQLEHGTGRGAGRTAYCGSSDGIPGVAAGV